MKTKIRVSLCELRHTGGAHGRSAGLLIAVALVLGLPSPLNAQEGVKLGITSSVLISWPEPTNDCIVVATDLPTNSVSVYTPCAEPIFNRCGELCMTVPTTGPGKLFRLVPGTQFVDDFSDPKQPFATRNDWRLLWGGEGTDWTITNDVMRVNWHGPVTGGGALIVPPGPKIVVADFSATADILDWKTSGTNWSGFCLLGRGVEFLEGGVAAVGGGLILNSRGIPGNVVPFMASGDYQTNGLPFQITEFPPPYHLECSGVGSTFSLRVFSLGSKEPIREMRMVDHYLSAGFIGLWFNAPAGVAASHNVMVDNYVATGTKP